MKEKKSSKRKVVLSVLALVICVAMLLGTTLAWFTDSVTSGRNKIVAGDLDIEAYHTNGNVTDKKIDANEKLFTDVVLWEPGAVDYENVKVENVGTVAAKVKLQVVDVAKNKMVDGDYDLSQIIQIAVKEGGFTTPVSRESILSDQDVTFTPFAGFEKAFELMADADKTYGIALYWKPTDSDNNWNANNGKLTSDGYPLWIEFGLNVLATQYTYEKDSFDDQYDKDATYPYLAPVVDETEVVTGNFAKTGEQGSESQVKTNEQMVIGESTIPQDTKLYKMEGGVEVPITTTNTDAQFEGTLVREFKTTASSENSVTFDISYTYVEGTNVTEVSSFSNVLRNEFQLSTGLKGVKVSHTHGTTTTQMTPVASPEDEGKEGYFSYNESTGKLIAWSSKYSDFKVTFTSEYAASINGQGYTTLNEAAKAAKAGDTILLLKDLSVKDADLVSYKDYWKDPALALISELKNGVTFDGANHTITAVFTKESTVFGSLYNNSVVKNLTINFNNSSDSAVALWSDGTKLQNVTTSGSMTWSSGNYGAFIIYPSNNNTLENCVNKAALQTTTGDTSMYTAVFFGYPRGTGTITLTNCKNEGSLVCGKAGLIAANWSYGTKTDFVLNNVKNCGTIQSTCTDFYGGAGKYNYCTSDYWDKAACLTFTFDGTKYTVETPTKWYSLDAQGSVIGEGGSFIAGPQDATLAIKENQDGTYTITPATASGVDHYVVSVGVYFGTTYGSGRAYATETLANGTTTTTLKNLSFVTKVWVAENPDATYGTLAGNPTYTKNSVSYYYIDHADATSNAPIPTEMVSVSAYDANGKLLASAGL